VWVIITIIIIIIVVIFLKHNNSKSSEALVTVDLVGKGQIKQKSLELRLEDCQRGAFEIVFSKKRIKIDQLIYQSQNI